MKRTSFLILGMIFVIALAFRFYAFRESTYFGYDQARDAYESQDIYLNRNLKIIGPPTTGNIGIFHGPLNWYFTGPVYLAFQGDPYGVSAFYRIVNAAGVFLVFAIGSLMIGKKVGLMAAFLYAISFEETQYSFYVGNPSFGVIFIPLIYLGAVLIARKYKHRGLPLVLMLGGAAFASQLNLMYAYSFGAVVVLLFFLRKELKKFSVKDWIPGVLTAAFFLSTYVVAELKYDFRVLRTATQMVSSGSGIMSPGQSKYLLFWEKYLTMYRDNFLSGITNNLTITFLAVTVSIWVLYMATKNIYYKILALWIFSWVFLMMAGGHTGYYTNAGIGVGIIIGVSAMILSIPNETVKKVAIIIVLAVSFLLNADKVRLQSPNSLIPEMITQNGMKLSVQYRIIDEMYKEADGKGFTVRLTGIPYKIQTVWAYLFDHYALPKYGYLPFWENGNALGYPGVMPTPTSGTTCVRFLLREPMRGLPGSVIEMDEKEEDKFSKIVYKREIEDFMMESRVATDEVCHNDKP